MREPHIEPGLLQAFRFLTGVRLLLTLLTFCGQSSDRALSAPLNYPIFNVIEAGVLMIYLAIPWLRRLLGRFYLPGALFMATVGPLLALTLTVWARMEHGYDAAHAFVDPGGVLVYLFIPLILLSTQYGFRTLVAYCLGTGILQIVLAIPAANRGGPALKLISDSAVIFIIIYMLVGYVIVRLMSAQRAQRRELAQTNVKLAEYANTLEQLAISRERNRMARDLHDTLAHTLSAVAIQLEALDALWDGDPAAARKTLSLSRDLTRSGLVETRKALQALRTNPLEDLGLALAIRHLAETTAARAGLQVALDVPSAVDRLSPVAEQSIYRIAEEALNNTARHANARHLTVALRQDMKQTMLVLADDGLGFDPAGQPQNGHYGLVGMRERATLCDGILQVKSAPGKGTQIRLLLEAKQ